MVNKIVRVILTLLGVLLGYGLVVTLESLELLKFIEGTNYESFSYIFISILMGIIVFILSPRIMKIGDFIGSSVEVELQRIPGSDIILGAVGLIVGLIIAYLTSLPIFNLDIPYLTVPVSVLLYLLFGYLGINVATKKREDFAGLFSIFKRSNVKDKTMTSSKSRVKPKVLDTSVIIDGRIADICKTGFVEGPLVIPEFVLEELRHIADSSDSLKRNRGRRGLDILNKIQKELDIEVMIYEKDFEEINEVDSKLLKLGQVLEGMVVTNDYNLNKVAEFHGVEVLNINELANAVKPVVLPGEEMIVQVIKDGKESGQGVAYLDDGTMIVVDSGRKHIGETLSVMVTSVLQTAAGRMIFAKPKYMIDRAG
ncbi:PIN/TRAM domain-containing protein [Clostridium sp. D2Q-11]|uniref:PIN/TRAM domain-containing protein n=1 Tax=Anaeromonas frigoriresistens TaxID=2683708 RepID=A0A942UPL0_9FIRM|nr:PIN/TRAM domain-containing protein [Anaeromonas frigoriresistens]MBS4536853.1 PIN/TRAM domain-containing protein [Anaeromonas frigoriresistens]